MGGRLRAHHTARTAIREIAPRDIGKVLTKLQELAYSTRSGDIRANITRRRLRIVREMIDTRPMAKGCTINPHTAIYGMPRNSTSASMAAARRKSPTQ